MTLPVVGGGNPSLSVAETSLPPTSRAVLTLFSKYALYRLWRNFQGFHLLHHERTEGLAGLPLLIYLNHPSWWDPLVGIFLSQYLFARRRQYGPIATEGLNKYKFFEKLGFFGIDPGTRAGAARFLRIGQAVLKLPDGLLWVTAQGQFSDSRVRPPVLQPGIAHLTHRISDIVVLPIALEYAYWDQRKPEAFAAFGEPMFVRNGGDHSAEEWRGAFADALADTQDDLAVQVKRRSRAPFHSVFHRQSTGPNTGGIYDLWRTFILRFEPKAARPRLKVMGK